MKLLGEWSHVGSGRVFRLIDVDDAAALPEATMPWTDVGNLDVFPVMEVEKILPRLKERMAEAASRPPIA